MSGFTWVPVFMSLNNKNWTNLMRIPNGDARVELRPSDTACNPNLTSAMCLAAGLEGIADQLDSG